MVLNYNSYMRLVYWLLLCALLAIPGAALDKEKQKEARSDYEKALSLIGEKRTLEASVLLDEAVTLDPENHEYLTVREITRQQLASEHIRHGEELLANSSPQSAAADFREALALDPQNQLAAERLRNTANQLTPPGLSWHLRYHDEPAIVLRPSDAQKEFHYKGNARGLLEQVWPAYGITPILDSGVNNLPLRFNVGAIDFTDAIEIVERMTKTFYVPLSPQQVMIFADTPENRKQYERLGYRTFYLPETSSPQEINDLANMVRSIFNAPFISQGQVQSSLAVRAPIETLNSITQALEEMSAGQPEIMLDVHIYQVDRTFARTLGLALPMQFKLFNVNSELGSLLKNSNNQDLINQLIASGGINQANFTGIAALLAALAAQGNSLIGQPIAIFGGGISRSGVVIPAGTLNLSLNESSVSTLDHVSLRAEQGNPATFKVGSRFPILNASFAPLANSPAINRILGNQTFQAPFPSFNYEDIGLTVKATPQVHGTTDITLKLEFQVRSLGAQSLNGIPIISTREYSGTVTVLNGETAVMAGSISQTEQRTFQGIRGLVKIPGIRELTSTTGKQTDASEILVTLTPNIIRTTLHDPAATEISVPASAQ